MRLLSYVSVLSSLAVAVASQSPDFVSSSGSTNNWAVLVDTSRFWFNYRHIANTMGMYRTVKRLGIPDERIILMLADDVACNPRNAFAGTVYSNANRALDLYGNSVEVDYRGEEVNAENFIRLLTGRVQPDTPMSKRLNTDERSNVFIYMTGHGGDEFLKFQDDHEISAYDLADSIQQMWVKKRYNELFFMVDTCQANTLYKHFYSPNVIATGCSGKGENSYSHHADSDIGVAVIDRYTHFALNYFEQLNKTSTTTLKQFFDSYTFEEMHSNAGVWHEHFQSRPIEEVRITDFLGGVSDVELVRSVKTSKRTTIDHVIETANISDGHLASPVPQDVRATPVDQPFTLRLRPSDESKQRSLAALSALVVVCLSAHWLSR